MIVCFIALFVFNDFCEFRFPIPLAQALGDNDAIGGNKDGEQKRRSREQEVIFDLSPYGHSI